MTRNNEGNAIVGRFETVAREENCASSRLPHLEAKVLREPLYHTLYSLPLAYSSPVVTLIFSSQNLYFFLSKKVGKDTLEK